MKKIALIHTVKPLVSSFEEKLKKEVSNIEIYNILDEYIAKNLSIKKGFEAEDYDRLYMLLKLAENTGADVILATCSSLSMAIESLKTMISVPVFKIDEAMIKQAVESNKKITVIATAQSTIEPTNLQLNKVAKKLNRKIEVENIVLPKAYDAMREGDMKLHDTIILNKAKELKDKEIILLAQGSMAHLEDKVIEICNCEVLSSIRLAVNLIKNIFSD